MEGGEVMAANAKKRSVAVAQTPTEARYDELNRTLIERQRELLDEVQCKIRDARAAGSERDHDVLDPGETSEIDIQDDIEFASSR